MAPSTVSAVAVVTLVYLLTTTPISVSAITCSQVVPYIVPCVAFARGGPLTVPCCNGVRGLNTLARTTADRRVTCTCLKSAAGAVGGIQQGAISSLPGRCGVRLPFAISANVDCSKVV